MKVTIVMIVMMRKECRWQLEWSKGGSGLDKEIRSYQTNEKIKPKIKTNIKGKNRRKEMKFLKNNDNPVFIDSNYVVSSLFSHLVQHM